MAANTNPDRPNILMIFSDDQGFSDVGWRNKKVRTPNLDRLSAKGIRVEGAYSQPKCTPSRVTLMTGKYGWKIGLSDQVFQALSTNAIRSKETLFPELLQQNGYDTHYYGKWHIGYCNEDFLPINRGFDTFHGFVASGGLKYYEHSTSGANSVKDYWVGDAATGSWDFRDSSKYTTDEFASDFMSMLDGRQASGDTDPFFSFVSFNAIHSPFDAPDSSHLEEFNNIPNSASTRRTALAMIHRMDLQIGQMIQRLEKTGELDNTVIIFQADNGPMSWGTAWPLRGKKVAYAEGGIRVPSFIVGPNIPSGTLHRTNFMHLTDWAATIMDYAGVDTAATGIDFDGHSFRGVFENNDPTPRTEMYHRVETNQGGVYRKGDYKLIYRGQRWFFATANGEGNGTEIPWEGICGDDLMEKDVDISIEQLMADTGKLQLAYVNGAERRDVMLFNIKDDPYELYNLYDSERTIADDMLADLRTQANTITESAVVTDEITSDDPNFPVNTGFATTGWCTTNDQ